MYAYTMEHICSYGVTLHSPFEVIGETPLGLRVNAYVSGGTVEGPRIRGEFLPVGGDWLTVRSDGVGVLDVRATIRTHDQALIYVQYQGVLELGDDGYARMLAGNPPPRAQIRSAPRFLSAHPGYLWVNRLQCVNIGEVDFASASVSYDVYALG